MTMRSGALVVALVMAQGSALAQKKPPTACQWDNQRTATTVHSGGTRTLAAGPGKVKCNKDGCTIKVEVVSYTPVNEPERCCTYIQYGGIDVEKKAKRSDPPIPLIWKLTPLDNPNDYVFGPVSPIILDPQPQPDDFVAPVLTKPDELTLGSVNNRFQKFNYELVVFRKYRDGSYKACDPNDPVIVNQG